MISYEVFQFNQSASKCFLKWWNQNRGQSVQYIAQCNGRLFIMLIKLIKKPMYYQDEKVKCN